MALIFSTVLLVIMISSLQFGYTVNVANDVEKELIISNNLKMKTMICLVVNGNYANGLSQEKFAS